MSGREDDVLDDEIAQRLARANPYAPEALDAHVPPRSGDLLLREIAASGRWSVLRRSQRRLETLTGPSGAGRWAFVGVLVAVSAVVVAINIGLPGPDQQDAARGGADGPSASGDVDDGGSPPPGPVPPTVATSAEGGGPADAPAEQPPTDPTASPETGAEPAPSSPEPPETQTTSGPQATTPSVPTRGATSGNCVSLEAEQLVLTGAWGIGYDNRVGNGAYAIWEGLSLEQSNDAPTDVIEAEINITNPGTYRFVWAMRQPTEADDDRANDSWLNFPDAARFGPIEGGTFGGFVRVFGNAKGEFDWTATAERDGRESEIGIVFDSPGTYTMQLAGRSHGHEIDQIIIYGEAVSRDEAINGRCGRSD